MHNVTVSVRNNNGSVLIVVGLHDRRLHFSPGLAWAEENFPIAEAQANLIKADILLNCFDPTFQKYKGKLIVDRPSMIQLFEKYLETKQRRSGSSQKFYQQILRYLDLCPSKEIDFPILDWLVANLPADSCRRVVRYLESCCTWGIERRLIDSNPFLGSSSKIRVVRSDRIDPFSSDERELIYEAFQDSEYYHRYLPFVKFLFLTGCRPGEAVALCWRQVDKNFEKIIFSQSVALGKIKKGLKSQSQRTFPCSENLGMLLLNQRRFRSTQGQDRPDDLVFPSPEGGLLNHINFNKRGWSKVLETAHVRHRTLYQTRHTFVSECVAQGIAISRIAKWVGSSLEIISRRYCGVLGDELPPNL